MTATTHTAAQPAAQQRPRLPRDNPLYATPDVAWPTVALFFVAVGGWAACIWAHLNGVLPAWATVPLQAFAIYALFTVLHDGVHRSLARGKPWLNETLSTISGMFLSPLASADAFRYAHLKHHRHTNEPETDPDMWSGVGPAWRLPLQWATADLRYGWVILRDWKTVDRKILLRAIGLFSLMVGGYVACWFVGLGWEATLYWLIPSRVAVLWLAFAFNYLPHHPHEVLQSHNPYAATNVRRGGEPGMKWLFLYQNYHLIHHLFPSVPFYRYLSIWRERRSEFTEKGTRQVPWYGVNPEAQNS